MIKVKAYAVNLYLKIPKAEIPEKELLERYPQIASFHRVSAIEGTVSAYTQLSFIVNFYYTFVFEEPKMFFSELYKT